MSAVGFLEFPDFSLPILAFSVDRELLDAASADDPLALCPIRSDVTLRVRALPEALYVLHDAAFSKYSEVFRFQWAKHHLLVPGIVQRCDIVSEPGEDVVDLVIRTTGEVRVVG